MSDYLLKKQKSYTIEVLYYKSYTQQNEPKISKVNVYTE